MIFLKKPSFWAKVTAILGVALSVYVQIFTTINVIEGHFSAELKSIVYTVTIISFVFVVCSLIGLLFLFQRKTQLAGTIFLISGLASLFFVHILAGALLIISGIFIKVDQK